MRTATGPQLAALAAMDRKELVRVRVANSAGSLVDRSGAFVSATIQADVDSIAVSGSVTFWRETLGASLSPLVTTPAPIAPGRRITIEVAVIEAAESVQAGDWIMLFDGRVDDVGWGGDESRLVVPVRDGAYLLRDTWIEDLETHGNDVRPVPVQDVMQAILDDVLEADAPTLVTVGDPDFGIVEYEQQLQSLADALGALANLIGWELRYLWDEGDSEFKLTFYEPDRDKATPDHTFGPDDYFTLSDVSFSLIGVRNVVRVRYADDLSVVAVDDGSVAEYDRRFMFLDYIKSPQITTQAQAQRLATAVLGDVSRPALTHGSENAFFWPVEIGDLYTFEANNVHYVSNQTVAVVGYAHDLSPEGNVTKLHCRGKPSGGAARWYRKGQRSAVDAVEDEEVPDLVDRLVWLYTTGNDTGPGYDAESDADNSLGGFISRTHVEGGLFGVFRQVTEEEAAAGITLYRSVAIANTDHGDTARDWECVMAYFSPAAGVADEYTFAAGLDPIGVVEVTDSVLQGAISADEKTAPDSDPAIDYSSPLEGEPGVLDVGTIPPGHGCIIHLRLEVEMGAEGQYTGEALVLQDRTPCDA